MTIRMTFEGAPVTVHVCTHCDTRTWSRDGKQVEMDSLKPSMRTTRGKR